MKRRLLTTVFSALCHSVAHGQFTQKVDVSNYIGYFRTSVPGSSQLQILSPLGVQVGYSYRMFKTSGIYGQYSVLSSGKNILLHGLNCGYEYFVLGGENSRVSIAENTEVVATFPQSFLVFSALSFRIHNLEGVVVPSNNLLRPTIPMTGKFVGLDLGVGYERSLLARLKMSARTSVLFPKFITSEDQQGLLISFAAGLGTSL